jgi:hypothetical protein
LQLSPLERQNVRTSVLRKGVAPAETREESLKLLEKREVVLILEAVQILGYPHFVLLFCWCSSLATEVNNFGDVKRRYNQMKITVTVRESDFHDVMVKIKFGKRKD